MRMVSQLPRAFAYGQDISLIGFTGTESGRVQLFSLKTGTEVVSPLGDHEYSHPIEALRFGNSEEMSTEVPSLLIGSNKRIDEWRW